MSTVKKTLGDGCREKPLAPKVRAEKVIPIWRVRKLGKRYPSGRRGRKATRTPYGARNGERGERACVRSLPIYIDKYEKPNS